MATLENFHANVGELEGASSALLLLLLVVSILQMLVVRYLSRAVESPRSRFVAQ